MDPRDFPDIPPRPKAFKQLVNRVMMFCLGRALQSLSKHDRLIRQEVAAWPEGFTLMICVPPCGYSVAVSRTPRGGLVYRGEHLPQGKADVVIYIKNVDAAFAMFTAQLAMHTAYAEHCLAARGDLPKILAVVRVINVAETYLFPSFLARKAMKRLPRIPPAQKYALRLKAYLLGVPFGI